MRVLYESVDFINTVPAEVLVPANTKLICRQVISLYRNTFLNIFLQQNIAFKKF